jgi:hypothetical protein
MKNGGGAYFLFSLIRLFLERKKTENNPICHANFLGIFPKTFLLAENTKDKGGGVKNKKICNYIKINFFL